MNATRLSTSTPSTSTMTAIRLTALSAVLVLALVAAAPPAGFSQGASPARGPEARLTLTIMDKRGRYIEGLAKDRVAVLEDGAAREIVSFEPSARAASIGVVFDMSRGDREVLLSFARAALPKLAAAAEGEQRYFIIGFDRETYLAADWVGSAEGVAAGLDRLAAVKPSSGKAALYDALGAALLKVAEGPHPKRAVILISDGRNDGSKLKRDELFEAVRRSDAIIYTVAVKPTGVSHIDASDHVTLNKLCSMSGGFPSSIYSGAQFLEAFERLSVELRHQYSVGFVPGDPGPAWRRLSFKAKPLQLKKTPSSTDTDTVQLTVRGREGYYSDQ